MKLEIFSDKKFIVSVWIIIIGLFVAMKFQPQVTSGNEIAQIKATANLEEQVKLYTQLIKRVGPTQAQEELLRSGMPFDGQTHLLNHTVGDYLYVNEGAAGLINCRDYFLSSCYHGFVLHAIGEGGMPAVVKTLDECRKVSPQTLTQCTHAVGHGFLTNMGYGNLIEALETCDEAGELVADMPLFSCYDGIFMENIWGIHDGKPSPERWVKEEDKAYPCNDPRIDDKYLLGCWSNQPALAYQLFNGNVSKVPAICMQIQDQAQQQMCFDGLARQIHPLTRGDIVKTHELCGLMPEEKWVKYCLVTNATSSFSVGDRVGPFELCSSVDDSFKSDCFSRLFSVMSAYIKDTRELQSLCLRIQDHTWRNHCASRFRG
jgi:hypothetical protein